MPLPTPTLHTARLRLRPFTRADADALFALHSSAHVLRYWDAPAASAPASADAATTNRIQRAALMGPSWPMSAEPGLRRR
jgi:RimJ/RimL family protein N-acetyltransferase